MKICQSLVVSTICLNIVRLTCNLWSFSLSDLVIIFHVQLEHPVSMVYCLYSVFYECAQQDLWRRTFVDRWYTYLEKQCSKNWSLWYTFRGNFGDLYLVTCVICERPFRQRWNHQSDLSLRPTELGFWNTLDGSTVTNDFLGQGKTLHPVCQHPFMSLCVLLSVACPFKNLAYCGQEMY